MNVAGRIIGVTTCVAVAGMGVWMLNLWADQNTPHQWPHSTAPVETVTPTAKAIPAPTPESQTFRTAADATGPTIGDRGTYATEVAKPLAPVNVAPPATAPGSGPQPSAIPECKYEDGSGQDLCLWRGDVDGNGTGDTYIVYLKNYYYLDGGYAAVSEATGPLTAHDPRVLMCGTAAGVATDTDGYGNNWAYCEPALAQK